MYKLQIGIGVNKPALYSTTCLIDKAAGPNLIIEFYQRAILELSHQDSGCTQGLSWHKKINQGTRNHPVDRINGTVQVRPRVGVGDTLAAAMLLDTIYIEQCIKEIFPMDRKTVTTNSALIPILDRSKNTQKNQPSCQKWRQCLTIRNTRRSESQNISKYRKNEISGNCCYFLQ